MPRKFVAKRLTKSDLTLFAWHFRHENAGNQKAINLNADVLVGELYPELPRLASTRDGKFPVDLFVFGPGLKDAYNLQRKIIKSGSSYKNWRLDGEMIHNPVSDPERFNLLQAGDVLILDFEGEDTPSTVRAVFLAKEDPNDAQLVAQLASEVESMKILSEAELSDHIDKANVVAAHPIRSLLLEGDLEDAAQGDARSLERVARAVGGRKVSKAELVRARQRADEIGALGEEFANVHLQTMQGAGEIVAFDWTSASNSISPYDFSAKLLEEKRLLLDAKATSGEFGRLIHASTAELRAMAADDAEYRIVRVYDIRGRSAQLRISGEMRAVARSILTAMDAMPAGVTVDSVSIDPANLIFGPPIRVQLPIELPG